MNIVKKDLDQNNAVVTLHVEKADYAENVEKISAIYIKAQYSRFSTRNGSNEPVGKNVWKICHG